MPLIFLGYDEMRLFSVADERERVSVPVFTDAEKAESYRMHFMEFRDVKLITLMVAEVGRAINLLQCIRIADPTVGRIAIDPDVPTFNKEDSICYTIDEAITALTNQYLKPQGPDSQARRKAKRNHRPRKRKAR